MLDAQEAMDAAKAPSLGAEAEKEGQKQGSPKNDVLEVGMETEASSLGGPPFGFGLGEGADGTGPLLKGPLDAYAMDSERGFNAPLKSCVQRIHNDLDSLHQDPVEGILVMPDEARVNVCHALIVGPSDTPYENGFFLFKMEFPNDYPHSPPRVTNLTTGGGAVRFNPNLYGCGKVCLSILGTYDGPGWTAVQNIGSVLLSIQSLLNSHPYMNEPGYEGLPTGSKPVLRYNQYIRYETIRIAVLDMVDLTLSSDTVVEPFLAAFIRCKFLENVEAYKFICDEYTFLDNREYQDAFSQRNGLFRFGVLKERIETLQEKVEGLDEEES